MIWTDEGIVLSERKYSENFKIVSVLTRGHGRTSGMISIYRKNMMSVFSNVYVDWSSRTNDHLGYWKVKSEKQNWVFAMQNKDVLLMCQAMSSLLEKVLPYGVVYERVYSFLEFVLEKLRGFSAKIARLAYSYFEFLLLCSLGFSFDLRRCGVCHKPEPIRFLSMEEGTTASSACSKHLQGTLVEIPDVWTFWAREAIDPQDILENEPEGNDLENSNYIVAHFFSKNITNIDNYFRRALLEQKTLPMVAQGGL